MDGRQGKCTRNCSAVRAIALSGLLAISTGLATAADIGREDWPGWRGPNRNNIANPDQQPPMKWSAEENVVWKVPVPGRGHSSPTVIGDRIFLATADEDNQVQGVLAFNRLTGESLWQTEISRGGFPKTHNKNTHATCTLACDGERVFVAFHHHAKLTAAALDLNGKIVWKKDVGAFDPRVYEYGYAPSPVLYGDTVILSADYEAGGYIVAYDTKSGNEKWRTPRPKKLSFSSPVIAKISGRDQLLISGCERVASYDPATGKGVWSVAGTTMATCGTMVWEGDLVFASGGYPKPQTICVKADGSKEIVWTNNQKCYEQSMLVNNGFLYAVTDQGVAYCWRARDGQEMWRGRLSGPISASPVLVGQNIFVTNERGVTYVLQADPNRFNLLETNQLGQESFATPAFCHNQIYFRVAHRIGGKRQEYLYCLGKKS